MRGLIKKYVPGAKYLWRKLYRIYKIQKSKRTKLIFTEKYSRNGWGSKESVSGYGSELKQTKKILQELPDLLSKYEIQTILDLPCGDFNWMHRLKYNFSEYIGADIVKDLIELNKKKYSDYGNFVVLNLLKDPLPKVDLIFCRDCLVHLSYRDINLALSNIKRSGAKYLMTTVHEKCVNRDILTGDWRPLNLEKDPFKLPPPLELLNEESTDLGSRSGKCLALWLIKEI